MTRSLRALLFLVVISVIFTAILRLTQIDYACDWTGFGRCITSKKADQDVRQEKTLWDWMQLLVVPAALAVGGLAFNQLQNNRERTRTERREHREDEMALDNTREDILQNYFNSMSELLVNQKLFEPEAEAGVRAMTRARTLATVRRLDGERKGNVIRFLYEAGLIKTGKTIVDLRQADLLGSDLRGALLQNVNLSQTFLHQADLRGAVLDQVDLTDVGLHDAILRGADFRTANLTRIQLNRSLYDRRTKWPDGFRPEDCGAVYDSRFEPKQTPTSG